MTYPTAGDQSNINCPECDGSNTVIIEFVTNYTTNAFSSTRDDYGLECEDCEHIVEPEDYEELLNNQEIP